MAISVAGESPSSNNPQSSSNRIQKIGNPVKLNTICDPYHRVSLKMEQFLTVIDLVPVDWKMDLKRFLNSDKEKQEQNQKGVISYSFNDAMVRYEKRCAKYGLEPAGCLRLLTNADSSYTDTFNNEFGPNKINQAANAIASTFDDVRNTIKSFGGSADVMVDSITKGNSQTAAALERAKSGYAGDTATMIENILLKGRRMSLPKIYTGSGYTPQFNASIKLVSPYGSPKAIQKFIVEPIIYLLLMTCPDTNDGLTYGGYTFLKIKAYGITDINLGYLSNLNITRGGQDVPTNKRGQPLTVTVTFTVQTAIEGFACINGNSDKLTGANVGIVQDDSVLGFDPIEGDYGLSTIDNIIKSFQPSPGSKKNTNNGDYGTGLLGELASDVQGGLSSFGSKVNSIKGGLTGSLSGALSSVLMS